MLEDILLPSNTAAKTTFCLNLVKLLMVTLRCAVNITTSFFSTFSLKFKCKICVQKEVIRNLQNHIWSPDQLRTYSFKENVAGLKNQITFTLFRICPTNRFSKAKQNHITFIFIKTMSHDALVQMA